MTAETRSILARWQKPEGELSGADDYVHLLYPLAPNAEEKRICSERAIEELSHFTKAEAWIDWAEGYWKQFVWSPFK